MVTKTIIAKQIVNILNDSSLMVDPMGTSRVGSFCFMPNQDMSYSRQLPKIKLEFDDQNAPDEKSMGKENLKHQKYISFNAWITVGNNQAFEYEDQKYRNEELVEFLEECIENSIVNNQNSIQVHLSGFGDILSIGKDPKTNTYIGVKPIMFRYRKQF